MSRSTQLWNAAAQLVGDDAFGLRAGSCAHPTMYHAFGMAMWSSSSYLGLFESWVRHILVISMAAVATMEDKGSYYEFKGHATLDANGQPEAADIAVDATIAALISIARAHGDAYFAPFSVNLMRSKPYNATAFRSFFACPVSYNADSIAMCFDKSLMDRRICQGNPVLMREM